MKKSRLFGIVLTVVLAVFFFTAVTPAVVSAADIYVGPGETNKTIQGAVNNATAGDTIIVRDGTYHENVDVGVAHLTIRSENGSANCIVNASDSNDHVFAVTVSYVNVSGLKITGATWWESKAGIYLAGADRCNISGNNATGNWHGIYLYNGCEHNKITNNKANSNSQFGIFLHWQSSYNNLTNNIANSNIYHGIRLKESSNYNNLTNNTANGNTEKGIFLYGSCEHNTLTGNTVNNNTKEGIFLENSCHYNNLSDNNAYNNSYDGIKLNKSSSNTLTNNTANSNNETGINLEESSNNILTNNTANSNKDFGFMIYNCTDNVFTNNSALNNSGGDPGIGFCLHSCDNNSIINNTISNSGLVDIAIVNGSNLNNISNNRIQSSGTVFAGIALISQSSNNTISNNILNGNSNGSGIALTSFPPMFPAANNNYNNITSNSIKGYEDGIYMSNSSNNTLTGNTANSNNETGIYLNSSSNNTITCNWVAFNKQRGFYLTDGSTGNNISYNNIMINDNYNFYNAQGNDVNATNNWWGTNNDTIINASIHDWRDDHSKGNVTFLPKLSGPDPCAPIPEAATIILFSIGLLVLAGYVRIRIKRKG